MDVGVGYDQNVVPRKGVHIDEIADFPVDSVLLRINHERYVARGVPCLQGADMSDRGVFGALHAEDDLEIGVVLPTDTFERLRKQGLVPVKGLEDRDGWQV